MARPKAEMSMSFVCPNCNVIFELKKCTWCGQYKTIAKFDISLRTNEPLPHCKECTTPIPLPKTCVICREDFIGRKSERTCSDKCKELWAKQKVVNQRAAERRWRISNKDKVNARRRERYERKQALKDKPDA